MKLLAAVIFFAIALIIGQGFYEKFIALGMMWLTIGIIK